MAARTSPNHSRDPRASRVSREARARPIRLTLAGLMAVPLASLIALWGFAANLTIGAAIREHEYRTVDTITGPADQALLFQLSAERAQAYLWLILGRQAPVAPLAQAQEKTDAAVAQIKAALETVRHLEPAAARGAMATFYAELAGLGGIRAAVSAGQITPAVAFGAYSDIVDAEFHLFDTQTAIDNGLILQQSIGSIDASRALEFTGREIALAGAAAANRGQMTTAERSLFATSVASQRLVMGDALALLIPGVRDDYARLYSGPVYREFAQMEDQISASVGARGPIPVSPARWQAGSQAFLAAMVRAQGQNIVRLSGLATQLSDQLITRAALAGGVGLLAVLVAIWSMLWFGRRLVTDLGELHASARSVAEERLPRLMERLRRGEQPDLAGDEPPAGSSRIAEIARVAQAFGTVQRAAVDAALDQAALRRGVSQVFLNLSLRSQSLLHRQLKILDELERKTGEPEALADLFRLDHLTTRMRRHAENLIILSGAIPGRGWRDPVPVHDVLRAAIAEVADYTRVEEIAECDDRVLGAVVNDVVHLLAELIENATAFSPPVTRVDVRAETAANGLVVEITDRGLGLTTAEVAQINSRLANPPEFDLADSQCLGLFVVGRLAARHQILVSLRRSPYGGTSAIVLLPNAIIVRDGDGEWRQTVPAAVGPGFARALARAHQDQPAPAGRRPAGTHAGMPVRVRQASLAPQLREPGLAGPPATGPTAQAREPERSRDLLSALQQGWQLGRDDDLDDPAGPASPHINDGEATR